MRSKREDPLVKIRCCRASLRIRADSAGDTSLDDISLLFIFKCGLGDNQLELGLSLDEKFSTAKSLVSSNFASILFRRPIYSVKSAGKFP